VGCLRILLLWLRAIRLVFLIKNRGIRDDLSIFGNSYLLSVGVTLGLDLGFP